MSYDRAMDEAEARVDEIDERVRIAGRFWRACYPPLWLRAWRWLVRKLGPAQPVAELKPYQRWMQYAKEHGSDRISFIGLDAGQHPGFYYYMPARRYGKTLARDMERELAASAVEKTLTLNKVTQTDLMVGGDIYVPFAEVIFDRNYTVQYKHSDGITYQWTGIKPKPCADLEHALLSLPPQPVVETRVRDAVNNKRHVGKHPALAAPYSRRSHEYPEPRYTGRGPCLWPSCRGQCGTNEPCQ